MLDINYGKEPSKQQAETQKNTEDTNLLSLLAGSSAVGFVRLDSTWIWSHHSADYLRFVTGIFLTTSTTIYTSSGTL
jgi:hypothetical protein